MDLRFAPGDAGFRQEVRAFLSEAMPPELSYKVENGIDLKREDVLGWHRILHDKGWVAPNWPKAYGAPA